MEVLECPSNNIDQNVNVTLKNVCHAIYIYGASIALQCFIVNISYVDIYFLFRTNAHSRACHLLHIKCSTLL